MGAPLTYKYAQAIFDTRRKSKDFKAYKTEQSMLYQGVTKQLFLGTFNLHTYIHTYNRQQQIL